MVFQPDFLFSRITNVSWAGGLWLAAFCSITTGNNSAAPAGSAAAEVGGTPANMLSGSGVNPLQLTADLLSQNDQISMYQEFITGNPGDDFQDSLQGLRLFKLNSLLSIFGPGVPIPGELTVTVGGGIPGDGSIVVGLVETKVLRGRTVELIRSANYTAGIPVPVLIGTRQSETQFGSGTKTLSFQIDVAEQTLTLV